MVDVGPRRPAVRREEHDVVRLELPPGDVGWGVVGHVGAGSLRKGPAGIPWVILRRVVAPFVLLEGPPHEARAVHPALGLRAAAVPRRAGLVPLSRVDVGVADLVELVLGPGDLLPRDVRQLHIGEHGSVGELPRGGELRHPERVGDLVTGELGARFQILSLVGTIPVVVEVEPGRQRHVRSVVVVERVGGPVRLMGARDPVRLVLEAHGQNDGPIEQVLLRHVVGGKGPVVLELDPVQLHGDVHVRVIGVVHWHVRDDERRVDRLIGSVGLDQRPGQQLAGLLRRWLECGRAVVLHPRVGRGDVDDRRVVPVVGWDVGEWRPTRSGNALRQGEQGQQANDQGRGATCHTFSVSTPLPGRLERGGPYTRRCAGASPDAGAVGADRRRAVGSAVRPDRSAVVLRAEDRRPSSGVAHRDHPGRRGAAWQIRRLRDSEPGGSREPPVAAAPLAGRPGGVRTHAILVPSEGGGGPVRVRWAPLAVGQGVRDGTEGGVVGAGAGRRGPAGEAGAGAGLGRVSPADPPRHRLGEDPRHASRSATGGRDRTWLCR